MTCPHCQGLEALFDNKTAAKELKSYRKKGASKTTLIMLDGIKSKEIEDTTLMDIGGGIGAVQHELLHAGVSRATSVDASTAYISAAKDEAERLGQVDRTCYYHGNFVDLAAGLPEVDIVTLDRVICCYPDMQALVGLSAERAGLLYGLVFPRETWWTKLGSVLINLFAWITRKDYRFFIHPSKAVEDVIAGNGLKRLFYRKTFFWQVAIYGR